MTVDQFVSFKVNRHDDIIEIADDGYYLKKAPVSVIYIFDFAKSYYELSDGKIIHKHSWSSSEDKFIVRDHVHDMPEVERFCGQQSGSNRSLML